MSLQSELTSETVRRLDLSGFSQTTPDAPVRDVLDLMRSEGNSVCLISGGAGLAGIFTERDVLRKVMPHRDVLDRPIESVMTPDPVTIGPDTSAAEALRLMDENHFRNLPVVDSQGQVIGIMTHQVVIHYLASRYPVEVLNRPLDPERFPRKAEGG